MNFNYPDWSTIHHKHWQNLIHSFIDTNKQLFCIEVGCFEGRSTTWFADKLLQNPNSVLYCIDNWNGGEEVERLKLNYNMQLVERNFIENISSHFCYPQIKIIKDSSNKGLASLFAYTSTVDFIYLDGSHTQKDTLVDLVLALNLIKVGGIIIIDDYMNKMSSGNKLLRPRDAVDFVVNTYDNAIHFSTTPERQAIILRKK